MPNEVLLRLDRLNRKMHKEAVEWFFSVYPDYYNVKDNLLRIITKANHNIEYVRVSDKIFIGKL